MYNKVVFLHFYAESNEMTKYLDQVKLKVERHPHFAMFRNGKTAYHACCSGLSWSSFTLHLLCHGWVWWLIHLSTSAGEQQFWFTGANKENFESYVQRNMTPEENPASGLSMFAMRAHRAKVGLTRS